MGVEGLTTALLQLPHPRSMESIIGHQASRIETDATDIPPYPLCSTTEINNKNTHQLHRQHSAEFLPNTDRLVLQTQQTCVSLLLLSSLSSSPLRSLCPFPQVGVRRLAQAYVYTVRANFDFNLQFSIEISLETVLENTDYADGPKSTAGS